jgi:hypothetical protein
MLPLDAVISKQDLSSGATSMKDARNRKVHLGNNSSELSPSVLVSRKTPSPKINKTSPEHLLLTNREFLKSVVDHIDALVYVIPDTGCHKDRTGLFSRFSS